MIKPNVAPDMLPLVWRRKQQSPSTHILQLPVELILCISDFLDPSDRVLFSMACNSLRLILKKYITKLSRTEYLSYLTAYARDKHEWVCEKCMGLHPMEPLDTPAAESDKSSCPHRSPWLRWDTRLWYNQIRLDHRHIQLSLKLTRLQTDDAYVQALLAPYHDEDFDYRANAQVKIFYSAYPKIVSHNGNLTFLLLSTWQFLKMKGEGTLSYHDLRYLPICPHVAISPLHMSCPNEPNYELQGALKKVFETQGNKQEHTGACLYCATDFSVQLKSPQVLDLHVWQNLGPEGSPRDLAWEAHCVGFGLDGVPNSWGWDRTLYHEQGAIRELYEEGHHDHPGCQQPTIGVQEDFYSCQSTLLKPLSYSECELPFSVD
ncbi:hypothetical protein F4678DRAFT_481677 [Xylaria arbuscula]|nr:hypothetical protein F4678DRAFT_481677 [Xylaria arbuscula]